MKCFSKETESSRRSYIQHLFYDIKYSPICTLFLLLLMLSFIIDIETFCKPSSFKCANVIFSNKYSWSRRLIKETSTAAAELFTNSPHKTTLSKKRDRFYVCNRIKAVDHCLEGK